MLSALRYSRWIISFLDDKFVIKKDMNKKSLVSVIRNLYWALEEKQERQICKQLYELSSLLPPTLCGST
ncbi:hypothetical protein Ciccas_000835 [Cichlidogyrus casuarinus]|uniref:Uncharacterized protein n=1 Tax=Cichlidogyrus casuarinus TaxID=1844966 RepID=A0ABD2QM15_9PLAT